MLHEDGWFASVVDKDEVLVSDSIDIGVTDDAECNSKLDFISTGLITFLVKTNDLLRSTHECFVLSCLYCQRELIVFQLSEDFTLILASEHVLAIGHCLLPVTAARVSREFAEVKDVLLPVHQTEYLPVSLLIGQG